MSSISTQPSSQQDAVTAINVLLEPDAAMQTRVVAENARLLHVFPHGFTFDEFHHPHVTMLQRFVRTADLDDVYAAVGRVLAAVDVRSLQLEATSYYYIESGPIGLAGIVSKPDPALRELQQHMVEALTPFAAASGQSGAFYTTSDDPVIDPMLIDYMATFVPTSTGEYFSPHVTTGIAPRDYLDRLLAEPFEPFSYRVTNVAVFQLSQFGTAAIKLHAWLPAT